MTRVDLPFSNLRAAVIVIVVAFHAALPYLASQPAHPFAFDEAPYRWIAFPILDHERWFGFDLFCAWQDVSLMALMFFLAGLFAPASIGRKGPLAYLSDRWRRIGVPFVLAAAILSPLAYYASYRLTAADPSPGAFWQHWRMLPMWPAGPQWFLWQLLALCSLAAALDGIVPHWREAAGGAGARLGSRPLTFFIGLAGLSALAYCPLAMVFSPWDWGYLGPFSVQLSRPALDLVFFFGAFALGSHGLDRGVMRADGSIARHWLAWLTAAVVCFALWGGLTSLTLPDWGASPVAARLAAVLAFPLACAAGVLAYLALALRFLQARHQISDSLSANAYGIYLVHYVFVLWLQYALVGTAMNAVAKMLLVLAVALAVSWATSASARILGQMMIQPLKPRPRTSADVARNSAIAERPR